MTRKGDEMTQEEKAKAYDEALEKARAMYGGMPADNAMLEEIFPELTESEDERIRTGLIRYLASDRDYQPCQDISFYKETIAWLEKQKKQKPISSCDIVPYIDDKIAALQDMWREEKVAFDWDDMHEMIEDVARHFYQKEQKQEWSEKDDEMIKMILGDLEWERRNTTVDKDIRLYDEKIAWLKSLHPSWKPNNEDEVRLINTSISFLKDFADKGYENAVECIDWLKSKLNGNTCE